MKICDLHTHVLPGVDDGAQTMEQALEMLRNAVASDVEYLVVTPHCNRLSGQDLPDLRRVYHSLCCQSTQIPVTLALGAEVYVTPQLPQLLQQKVFPTINGSRYLLTEFSSGCQERDFLPMLKQICSLGYVPVVAHPERYDAVLQAPEIVYPWLDLGCHIQLTAGSVVGKYGTRVQKAAAYLLENGLACCVASDAHGTQRRNNNLLEVQAYLSLYYSRQCAKALLWDNPMRIVHDEAF